MQPPSPAALTVKDRSRSFNGVGGTAVLQYGGSFDMGFTNSSLYTGDINYTAIPDGQESFWLIPLIGMFLRHDCGPL